MNFGRFERSRYKTYLVPTFGNFLKNCYCKSCHYLCPGYTLKTTPAPDECRSRGLALSSGIEAMIKFDFEGLDVNVDSVDMDPAVATSASGSALSTSGLLTPSMSGSSAPLTSASPTLHASKDAHIGNQPSSTTAPSVVTEKTPNEELIADGVLGGQGGGDDGTDNTPPPSPMFHSIFDLPLSPVLHEEELVPDSNSPAPTETPVLNETSVPITIVSTATTISTPLSSSATALSAVTASLSIATTTVLSHTTSKSPPSLLKRKGPAILASSNVNGRPAAKRLRRAMGVEKGNDVPAAAAAKPRNRRKQSSTSSASAPATGEPSTLPLSSSSDAAWLKSAFTMLTAGNLGNKWTNVVNMWALFERKEISLKPTVLGSSHRPAAVHDWIQRARSALYRPSIASIDRFETSYKLWWASLQPDWHVSASGEVAFAKTSGNWDAIRKPGRNGILSVAAALFFWGLKVKDTEDTNGWEIAVDDLLLVLLELLK